MSVVRRGTAGAVVAGIVLLGGPVWAQVDPCVPGADGQVPVMCQGGAAPEPAPDEPVGAPEPVPVEECLGQPVEPSDGVVTDPGDPGIAVGEPNPGIPVEEPAGAPAEPKPEPEPEQVPVPEQIDPMPVSDASDTVENPGVISDDGLICAFSGVPVSAPVADGVLETTGGGADTSAGGAASGAGGGTAAGQLPRTGLYDQLALTAIGSGLVVAGAGAVAAGRRRTS
jgi:hypothetical protein